MALNPGVRTALELLYVEVCDAWFEYLESTRYQGAHRYDEVEPWAWKRLQQRLATIEARRDALAPRKTKVAA